MPTFALPNLKPAQLSFVVPWVIRHATADERRALTATAGLPLRLFEGRFRERERLLFRGAA